MKTTEWLDNRNVRARMWVTLRLTNKGLRVRDIAEVLGVTRQTVYNDGNRVAEVLAVRQPEAVRRLVDNDALAAQAAILHGARHPPRLIAVVREVEAAIKARLETSSWTDGDDLIDVKRRMARRQLEKAIEQYSDAHPTEGYVKDMLRLIARTNGGSE